MALKKEGKLVGSKLFVVGWFLFLILALSLTLANAANYSVKVTNEHPFLLVNGKYVRASELKVGDELKTVDGKKARVTGIHDVFSENPFEVYNLETALYHDFVLPGGIVVHNSNPPRINIRQRIDPARSLEEQVGEVFSSLPKDLGDRSVAKVGDELIGVTGSRTGDYAADLSAVLGRRIDFEVPLIDPTTGQPRFNLADLSQDDVIHFTRHFPDTDTGGFLTYPNRIIPQNQRTPLQMRKTAAKEVWCRVKSDTPLSYETDLDAIVLYDNIRAITKGQIPNSVDPNSIKVHDLNKLRALAPELQPFDGAIIKNVHADYIISFDISVRNINGDMVVKHIEGFITNNHLATIFPTFRQCWVYNFPRTQRAIYNLFGTQP